MLTQAQKARLGAFVLLCLGTLVLAVTLLAGRVLLTRSDRYVVYFTESVSGLEVGAPVKLNGVRVGLIDEIRIPPDDISQVEVSLALLPDTPVKVDTRASIGMSGLTGLRYVELIGGTRKAKRLKRPGPIRADMSFMATMADRAGDITDEMHVLLRQVVQLTNSENQAKITSIMDSLAQFAENSNRLVETSQTNLKQGIEILERNTSGIAELTREVHAMMAENREALRRTTAATEQAVAHLARILGDQQLDRVLKSTAATLDSTQAVLGPEGVRRTMAELDRTLASSRKLIESLDQAVTLSTRDLAGAMQNLERTLANLEQFTRTIKEQPTSLLSGRRGGKQ
jgi:phospholipid/cholesterol/gamma-HCH transport system substrate-binding protein